LWLPAVFESERVQDKHEFGLNDFSFEHAQVVEPAAFEIFKHLKVPLAIVVEEGGLSDLGKLTLEYLGGAIVTDSTGASELPFAEAFDLLELFDHLGQFGTVDIGWERFLVLDVLLDTTIEAESRHKIVS